MATAGTFYIMDISGANTIFSSGFSRYSIQNNSMRIVLEGGLKDISQIQQNTAYNIRIESEVADLDLSKMALFQNYSYNCGSTTYEDESGVHTGIAILDNSMQFQIIG